MAVRETIESIVIAFILAFLFRTFEAEAFVIPTGSMAPTLMGRHKDLLCPKCGSPYQVSASEEVTQDGVAWPDPRPVESGTCPMCRYTAFLGPRNPQRVNYPSYNGDRILVSKFTYQMGDPKRWDVIVFRYPGDAQINFIKRLVGLPGETVRIQDGDIWIRADRETASAQKGFSIARKPPEKLLAMLQPVFDNDYMPKIAAYGWPARWQADSQQHAPAWTSDDSAVFETDGTAPGENWLRYHHRVPSSQQWQVVEERGAPIPALKPQLITDFTAYDTGKTRTRYSSDLLPDADALGAHWVGDLALECTVDVEKPGGELIFELCKGGRQFQCRFEVDTGRATLAISGPDLRDWRPSAVTPLKGPGRHSVRFSNCDNELLLWVDDRLVAFDAPTAYRDLGNAKPHATDLAPAGAASKGAAVRIGHLRLMRDLYYVAQIGDADRQRIMDYDARYPLDDSPLDDSRSGDVRHHVDFRLGADQFFVLGDNSAKSKDSRLWGDEYWVGRELLIGKALFIYWPHSWNEIRTPWVNVPFPYFPNFHRMELVR